MGLVSLLFSFNGRVNRAQYWLGSIGVQVVNFMFMFGMSAASSFTAASKDPAAALAAAASQMALILPVSAAVTWVGLALQVKRFHDRGQSGWWAALPMAPAAFMVMNIVSGVFEQWPAERLFASLGLPFLALIIISIGFFINLGCLPGTQGPNKFGNPPGSGGGSVAPVVPGVAPSAAKPNASAAAASSLFSAQSAIDRAIAEKAQQRTAPRPQAPAPQAAPRPAMAGAPAAPASFGRRTTR